MTGQALGVEVEFKDPVFGVYSVCGLLFTVACEALY